MEIVDLDEMGLIDSSTEFVNGISESSIIYTQDGSLALSSDDLSSYGSRVAYVTLPNLVQFVQDENSPNVSYIINSAQVAAVNQAFLVNQDGYVELEIDEGQKDVNNLKEGCEDSLHKQLSDYLTTPSVIEPIVDEVTSKETPCNSSNCDKIIDDNHDVDPPDKTGSMFCDKCNQQFSSWKLYKKHKWKHLHEKPFQCSFCPESFNYELNLNLHLATHNEKPYCPVCKKHFSRVASLKAHIMLHEQEESLFCNECGEEFASHIYLHRHMVEHRTEKSNQKPVNVGKAYKCRPCNQSFDSANNYKLHRVKFHKVLQNKKMKKLKRRSGNNMCEYCQKCFDKPSQLLRHKRIHTGERPYKCDLCPRAFNQKGSVQIHMLKHTRERPYVCQYCHGTFSQKGNLQAHVRRLHMEPEGDEKVFKCELCTCIFRKLGSLNAHFTKVHTESNPLFKQGPPGVLNQKVDSSDSSNKENETSKKDCDKLEHANTQYLPEEEIVEDSTLNEKKGRNVICSYCSKVFKRPGDLVRHIRTHTLEKPFKCHICDRGFSLQSTLSIHLKTHSDGRKYTCPICKKSYSNGRNLKLHRKKHIMGGNSSDFEIDECLKEKDEVLSIAENSNVSSSAAIRINRVDISSLEPNNIIVTENGNIVDLSSDIEEEAGDKLSKCLVCNMVFPTKSHLTIHLKIHNNQNYCCDHCPCTFNSRNTLKLHLKQQHSTNELQSTDSDSSSMNHLETGEVNRLPWGCSLCGATFKSQQSTRRHILTLHSKDGEKAKVLMALGKTEAEENKKDIPQEENSQIPIAVMNQIDDLPANLKDLMSIQQNQVFILANEDGGFSVPHKPVMEGGDSEAYTVYQEDLIMNTSESNNLEKQVFENGLNACIFTLQPGIEANGSIINAGNLSNIVSQAPDINRCEMTNLILTNLAEFSDDKTARLLEKPHTCISCEKSFSSAIEYEEHMKLHKASSKIESKKSMDNFGETPAHIQNVFTCATCCLNFITLDDLTTHQKEHVNIEESKYASNVCRAQFDGSQELQEHCKEHIIDEIFKCSLCLMETSTEEDFAIHCQKYHGAQILKAEKKKVRLNWRPPARRLTEEETKVLSQIEPDNASEKVLLQSLLEKERYEHPVKEQPKPPEVHPHKCKHCPKSFRKPSDLIRHLRTHTGEKPYKCTSCNKRFSIKSAVACHLKTHTKDKSYECYICSKMFSTTGSLKIHMRLHTGLKPFACNICDARFRTSGHKKAHLLKHQKEVVEKSGKKDRETDVSYNENDGLCLERDSEPINENTSAEKLPEKMPYSVQDLPPAEHESQFLVPLQTDSDSICALTSEGNDEFLMSFKISDPSVLKEGSSKTSKFLLNINDEGGGTGATPRYFLSIKDGGTGEDGFVLESISDDQIIVTITKGDSDLPNSEKPMEECESKGLISPLKFLTCLHCQKTFSKQITLEKHIKKFHTRELLQCDICFENFEQQSDLDLHCLAHELDKEYTCAECGESFPLEEEFRAHKCVKAASLDLSLEEHDLFLFS